MKHFTSSMYFIFAPCLLFSQQIQPLWERTEATNGNLGTLYRPLPIVLTDAHHNVVVCGETYNSGPIIGFVTTKYDSSGNFLWQRKYDTPGQDYITASIADNTGAVYVGGNATNPITTSVGLVIFKYATDGTLLWQYEPPVVTSAYFNPSALLLDQDQNLLIFTDFFDVVTNNSGLQVTKLDPDGNTLWETFYDESDYGYIGIDARWVDDHLVFWGQKGSPEGVRFIAWQISNTGETLAAAYSDPYTEGFNRGYKIDNAGNLFIGAAYYEYKVTKFTLDGSIDWTYNKPVVFPPAIPSAIRAQEIALDTLGAVYVSGVYHDSTGFQDITTKLSADGELIWEHKINFNGIDLTVPQSIKWLNGKLLLVTGSAYTHADSNFYEPFLAFYDQNGFVKGGISDISGKKNQPVSITADGDCFYVAGITDPTVVGTDLRKQFLCKYALDNLVATLFPFESAKVEKLTVSPNPFRDHFSLAFNHRGKSTYGVMEMTDTQGKIVLQQQLLLTWGDNSVDIKAVQNLPSGLYGVSVKTGDCHYSGIIVKRQ